MEKGYSNSSYLLRDTDGERILPVTNIGFLKKLSIRKDRRAQDALATGK